MLNGTQIFSFITLHRYTYGCRRILQTQLVRSDVFRLNAEWNLFHHEETFHKRRAQYIVNLFWHNFPFARLKSNGYDSAHRYPHYTDCALHMGAKSTRAGML